ncbi:MAG: fibronectin type III domain-containing protein [Moorellales bacterium]
MLYNQVSWHYADQWKGPWVAPSGATIVRARFKGNSESGYDYGYVYAYVGGTWYYVTRVSGSYDYWVNLPSGTTQIETRMITDGSVLWNPTYTDVPEVVINIPIVTPGQPQLPYDSSVPYWQQRVTWSSNGNPSGTVYELWRKTFNSAGQLVSDDRIYSGTGTSFVTTDQQPGRYYTYRVRAVYQGYTSGFSAETPYWTMGPVRPLEPAACSIKVSWDPVYPNVTYRVWVRPSGGSWTSAGTTTATSFTAGGLDPTKSYDVAVGPVLPSGGTDWWQSAGSAYPLAAVPGTPTFGQSGSDSIPVSWSANGNPSGVVYELRRNDTPVYTGTATSYTDTGLEPGQTYRYKVRAKNGAGQYTAFSAEAVWGTAPVAPTISTQSYSGTSWSNSGSGQGQVNLTWQPVPGATGYKVYLNGSPASGGDVGSATRWTGTLSGGTTGQFQVSAYNSYGEGPKSALVSVAVPNRRDTAASSVVALINNGQLIAASKFVAVSVSATDPLQSNSTSTTADDASQPRLVRLSNDNTNWSGWMAYGMSPAALTDASTSFEDADFVFQGDPAQPNGFNLQIGNRWCVATHYNSAAIKSMADGGFHGRKYVRFEHDGSSGWKGLVRDLTITGGKWYRITAYARTNSPEPVDISGDYAFYSSQFRKNFVWEKEVKADNGWVKGQAVFQAPETISGGIYLYGLSSGANGVTLDYDFVVVEQFDNQPAGDVAPDAPYPWTLDETGFGKKTVYVQVQDAAGNVASAQASINYYLVDMQAPQVSVSINGGQAYTSSPTVALEVNAKDDLTQADLLQMRFSTDFKVWTGWEPYAPYRSLTLPGGDGMKTVYVQVKDASGNVGTGYASIVLQTSSPGAQPNPAVFSSTSGSPGTIVLNGQQVNVRFVKGAEVVLLLNAPGASWVQYSMDNVRWTSPEPVQAQKVMALPDWEGTKTVYARLPDGRVYSIVFVLDRTPPQLEVAWKGGATAAPGSQATAVVTASDNFTPDAQLEVSTDGTTWVPYSRTLTVSLLQSGYNEVTVWVRDKAGNIAKKTLGIWRLN